MKLIFRTLLILPLLLLINGRSPCAEEPEYVPAIKGLVVNGEKVPAMEVRKLYDELLRIYKKPGKPLSNALRDKLAEKAREQAIYHAVVRQFIAKNNLAVDAAALKEEIEIHKGELLDEGNDFRKVLELLNMTEEQFAKTYEPRAALRRYMARELEKDEEKAALKKKFDEGKDKIPFRRASHLLISFEGCKFSAHKERKREDALALVKAALERALKGEEFADLVKEFTDDSRSKAKAGDLDWLKPADMPKPFTDALYALEKVGDIVKDAVETELGFHVIKMTGLRPEDEAFKKFMQLAVKSRTMDLQNKLFKEAKIEELAE